MKTFISTLSNTYRTFKLLSNPAAAAFIEQHIQADVKLQSKVGERSGKLGSNSVYYHKHYMVQVC